MESNIVNVKELIAKEFKEYLRREEMLEDYIYCTLEYQTITYNVLAKDVDMDFFMNGQSYMKSFQFNNTPSVPLTKWRSLFVRWEALRSNILNRLN